MGENGRRETVKGPAKRTPDAIPTQPMSCRATLVQLSACWTGLEGAGGCSRCLVPDSWAETYLGRQAKTLIRISRSVEYLYDKSPASLLGQACVVVLRVGWASHS